MIGLEIISDHERLGGDLHTAFSTDFFVRAFVGSGCLAGSEKLLIKQPFRAPFWLFALGLARA